MGHACPSAAFLAELLGIRPAPPSLASLPSPSPTASPGLHGPERKPPSRYAFLISDSTFDAAFKLVTAGGIVYHAEPNGDGPGEL
jgi:hypothetical protein